MNPNNYGKYFQYAVKVASNHKNIVKMGKEYQKLSLLFESRAKREWIK